MILVIAATNSYEESKSWSSNFAITLGQDMFITPMIKVLITIFVLKKIRNVKSRFWFKVTRKFADPLTTRALTILTVKPMSLDELLKQKALDAIKNDNSSNDKSKENQKESQTSLAELAKSPPDNEDFDYNPQRRSTTKAFDNSLNQSRDELVKKRIGDPNMNRNSRIRRERQTRIHIGAPENFLSNQENRSPLQRSSRRSRNPAAYLDNSFDASDPRLVNFIENDSSFENPNAGFEFQKMSRKPTNGSPSMKAMESDYPFGEPEFTAPNRKTSRKPTNGSPSMKAMDSDTPFEGPEPSLRLRRQSRRQTVNNSPKREQISKNERKSEIQPQFLQQNFVGDGSGNAGEERRKSSPDRRESIQKSRRTMVPVQNTMVTIGIDSPLRPNLREPEQAFRTRSPHVGGLIKENENGDNCTEILGPDLRKVKMQIAKGGGRRFNI